MKKKILTSIIILFLVACKPTPIHPYTYHPPEGTDDGIKVGTLEMVGIDPAPLEAAVDAVSDGKYGEVHSILIYKDGRLVFEKYFRGHDYKWDGPGFHGAWVNWNRDKEHNVHSVGKSITSACVGIAVEQGFIRSVDDPIFDYLPEHQHLKTDGKNTITIENLLTMTSGLDWDEWGTSYSNENNDVIALWVNCDDPITCILSKPLSGKPGISFNYSGGDMVLLGEIVKNASGMDIEAFSWQYLFEPMGVEIPEWRWIDREVIYAGGDQKLTPREMLKFGVTYLNSGSWGDQQIVPETWVEKSASPYSGPENTWLNHALRPIPPGSGAWGQRGYSYTWWTHRFSRSGVDMPAYWASGWGGQKIIVLPEQDAVVVLTGANYSSGDVTVKILKKFILPAF
jgi:CubicO group peptidase (beta-lactamase class C family)